MVTNLISYKLVQKQAKVEESALRLDQMIVINTHEHVICAKRSKKDLTSMNVCKTCQVIGCVHQGCIKCACAMHEQALMGQSV